MVKRMFVALDLPGPVAEVLAGLDPQLDGLRWLPAPQLHLTLAFLAAVPEAHQARLIDALEGIRAARFSLEVRGLGCFVRSRRPAVVWAGIVPAPSILLELQCRVQDAVVAAGLAPDHKPFHPHITVGRCKGVAAATLHAFLEHHETSDFGAFEVTGFTLYSSLLHPHGAEHVPVFRQAFDGVRF